MNIANLHKKHSIYFLISTGSLLLLNFIFPISKFYGDILFTISFFLIITIGISHGGLDHIKGKKLLKRYKTNSIVSFYVAYIVLCLGIIILWKLFPIYTLVLFLFVAAYHFGKEDTPVNYLKKEITFYKNLNYLLRGSLVIVAPLYFHTENTQLLFKLLSFQNKFIFENSFFSKFISNTDYVGIWFVLSLIAFLPNIGKKINYSLIFDCTSIVILNWLLLPVYAFTVYFCFLHSVRHSMTWVSKLDKTKLTTGIKKFLNMAFPLTALTGILFIFSALFMLNLNDSYLNSVLTRTIFVGLASLTFPHILLEYLLEKNEK